jgi:ParB-like chromosome segregation protein Spo0J
MSNAKLGFELRRLRLALETILPVRTVKDLGDCGPRYKTILASVKEVGLVEPLVVHPAKGSQGRYLLLDGHFRFYAMKELGLTEAECIISTDDEGYTYNARVNRLNPIQEHKMITKAVQNGLQPERIAAALNMPLRVVYSSMSLLNGIHEEAADLLKDKAIAPKTIRLLRKVKSVRQIEMAELMVSANNFTISYAEALLMGTTASQLVNPDEGKAKAGLSAEEIARMEAEMEGLEQDLKAVEDSYTENVMTLTLARGYIRKLLENAKVVRFLNASHGEILGEFEAIAAAETV